jgi:hypothetical protein
MKNRGSKLKVIIITIIIIFVCIFGVNFIIQSNGGTVHLFSNSNSQINTEILGNKEDLVSLSVKGGDKVSGVLTVIGSVKGGYFFEANILINILDSNKNVLKSSNGNATADWMTSDAVPFQGDIDFSGLPKGPAYIEIHNDNASGLSENDKSILIPIIIE